MLRRFGLLAVCGIAFIGLMAAEAPPPEFKIELLDGSTVQGKLLEPAIRLKDDIGIHEYDLHKIKRITFRLVTEEAAKDTVYLADKSSHRGKLQHTSFQLETEKGTSTIKLAEAREMKSIKKEVSSIWAILLGLLTLTAMEIVLGIDNIIFLAIIAAKLPKDQQPKARTIGLIVALGTRLLLLASLTFLMGLTKPIFTLPHLPLVEDLEAREVSMRDLILLVGGMFLIFKSVREMHDKIEKASEKHVSASKKATFGMVLIQIAIVDVVFSLDSVITAVGMVDEIWVMVVAMLISMAVMMIFAGSISEFVSRNPTIKVLALAFLILIGVMLVAEGLGQHMDKGYIYFAMAFAIVVEMINIRVSRKPGAKPDSLPKA